MRGWRLWQSAYVTKSAVLYQSAVLYATKKREVKLRSYSHDIIRDAVVPITSFFQRKDPLQKIHVYAYVHFTSDCRAINYKRWSAPSSHLERWFSHRLCVLNGRGWDSCQEDSSSDVVMLELEIGHQRPSSSLFSFCSTRLQHSSILLHYSCYLLLHYSFFVSMAKTAGRTGSNYFFYLFSFILLFLEIKR